MPLLDPLPPARDPVRWSPVATAFAVLGMLFIVWAAAYPLGFLIPERLSDRAAIWPLGAALTGGILLLLGLLLTLSDPHGFRRRR